MCESVQSFTESTVEHATLAWLQALGWGRAHGPDIAPDTLAAKRCDYREMVLSQRLFDALAHSIRAFPSRLWRTPFARSLTPRVQI